jgi:threonine synthase
MDIQVSSNFERFLYLSIGRDSAKVREVMETFKKTGGYKFENFDRDTFSASRCTDAQIPAIIKEVYQKYGYVVDPHTACGFTDLSKDRPSLVLATASPAKFPDTIIAAIGVEPKDPSLETLKQRPLKKHLLKADAGAIRAFIDAHAV